MKQIGETAIRAIFLVALIVLSLTTLAGGADIPGGYSSEVILVKFVPGVNVHPPEELLRSDMRSSVESISRLFGPSEDVLDDLRSRAEARAQEEDLPLKVLPDLNLWFQITLTTGTNASDFMDDLISLESVEIVQPAPLPPPPPAVTPDFTGLQGYVGPATDGINAIYSWTIPGGNGSGVRIYDVEYSWNKSHEDLSKVWAAKTLLLPLDRAVDPFSDANHGTAVLGELVADNDSKGVTGISWGADVALAPAQTRLLGYNPANAILLAVLDGSAGDVILIEQQIGVCFSGDYGPLEWLLPVFHVIQTAVASGFVVVEAAGNGAVDLDRASCLGYFDRNIQDSGAIIVGAGGAPDSMDRQRLDYSSFGSRVDLQGWGRSVVTTGYGDHYKNPDDTANDNFWYASDFGGTSSASPIVAGAVANIQGIILNQSGSPLSAHYLRDLLVATGSPQLGNTGEHIGPRPNLPVALAYLGIGITCPDDIETVYTPPAPWVQEGFVIDTVCVVANEDLFNLRFIPDPLQCTDVPCGPGDAKKIHENMIEFVPEEIAFIPEGEEICVEIKKTVPIGQHACTYEGQVHVIAETAYPARPTASCDFLQTLEVLPVVDMDLDDNHGNVSDNVMHLKGAKGTTVSGVFTVINPNSEVNNVDLPDGPGNIGIDPVSLFRTSLVKIGDPTESIPYSRISHGSLRSLCPGEAQDVQVDVSIPDGLPVNAVYEGIVQVTYDECVHADRPNRKMLGAGFIYDEFTLRVEVLPTQGDLSLELVGREHFCPNPFPNPWVQPGHAPLSFNVRAYGDHRNIRISSGGLRHDSLDTKLDDFNFFPEEIAFIPAGQTRSIIAIGVIPIGQHEGSYLGAFRAVSESGGESEAFADVDVCDLADVDIDDNHGNVSDNVMTLRGAKNDTISGTYTVINPNCLTTNVDFSDGPGNVGVKPVSIVSTDLQKVGGPEVIPSANIWLDALPHLESGGAKDLGIKIVIPGDIPVNAVYVGRVRANYQGDLAPFPELCDSFELKVELFPTQGPLDIADRNLAADYCPPDPWTQNGQIEYAFDVTALGDHRNIRLSSGGLRHDSLDKKLDDFNFFPAEIAFLAAGETREVMVIAKAPIGQHHGVYSGVFRVVSENGGEDSVFAQAEICAHPDLDIEDDVGNLVANTMHLEAPRGGVAYGTFSVVNPNLPENNGDLYDGPGNLALHNLVAIPSDLWFTAGGAPPKEPIYGSTIDIGIYPDAAHVPSGAGAYGVVQVPIPKKSEHWVPGYNFEYWGDVEVRGYVAGDSVHDGFKIELRVLKAIGGSLLSGFYGERESDANVLRWSNLGLSESGYNLYRDDIHIAHLGQGVYEYTDYGVSRAALEYELGVDVGGSEIMIGPVVVGGVALPTVYALSQNQPNPFSGSTTLRYQVPFSRHVSLRIYDVSGKLVRTLVDGAVQAGSHHVSWNGEDDSGKNTSNGVYFYRMISGDFSKTLKMTLLR